MKKILLISIITIFLTSCSTKKEIVFFQGIENLDNTEREMSFEPVFEINDILHIKVTSLNPMLLNLFR